MTAETLFCFGYGFSARALCTLLRPAGWRIVATTRTSEKADVLAAERVEPVIFTGTAPMDAAGLRVLREADHVLISIPPGPEGDPILAHHGADLAACSCLTWLGYLSTTGVYGDQGGGWVDEETPPAPTTDRGRRRLAAEDDWQALWREAGVPVQIFRLAGIYGPGRSPLDAIEAGRARRIIKPDQVFSRIHVVDIARVLTASMARPNPGRIYNVCDDLPCPPQDPIVYAAHLLRREPPPAIPFAAADLSPMAQSFYADNKRVRNDRIKKELGVKLAFPTYREGLAAMMD